MSSNLILKLSLVTMGGISLAEIPKTDETVAQLAGGLTAALFSFASEVHTSALKSIRLHDRSLSFIQAGIVKQPGGQFYIAVPQPGDNGRNSQHGPGQPE